MEIINIKKILKANLTIYLSYIVLRKRWYNLLYNDKEFLLKRFKKTVGKYPDLENPKTFYEKLIWSMLNHRNELFIQCADKYEVREFVRMKVGEEYLVKNYAIYDKYEQIKLDELPDSFVLKATHASGWNLICKDKNKLNKTKTLKLLRFWLSNNYYEFDREWLYNYMQKRVICEEYLCTEDGIAPMDYKIYCFNGEPKYIQLDIDRFTNHKRNLYDINWDFKKDVILTYQQDFSKVYEKPINFEKMLEISRTLSKGIEHVRIDLYNLKGKIYFGEMTFFSSGGVDDCYSPKEFDLLVGSWYELPNANVNNPKG